MKLIGDIKDFHSGLIINARIEEVGRVQLNVVRFEEPPGFEPMIGKHISVFALENTELIGLIQQERRDRSDSVRQGNFPDLFDNKMVGFDFFIFEVQEKSRLVCEMIRITLYNRLKQIHQLAIFVFPFQYIRTKGNQSWSAG